MNDTMEIRLRRLYHERTSDIPEHGPDLADETMLIVQPSRSTPRRQRTARVSIVIGSAAAMTILLLLFLNRSAAEQHPATRDPDAQVASTLASGDELAPAQTLPLTADVTATPVTVASDSPTDWYRLQPDLDIAWYQDPAGSSPTMVCWRTPAGSECLPDEGPAGALPLIVPTAAGQTLVVSSGVAGALTLDVQLTSGAVLSGPFDIDSTILWGVARYVLPPGATIASVDGHRIGT